MGKSIRQSINDYIDGGRFEENFGKDDLDEFNPKEERRESISNLQEIENDTSFILTIKNPIRDEFELAFDIKPELAGKFDSLPEEVQEFLIEKDPKNVQYLISPSHKIQYYIIMNHRDLIPLVKKLSLGNRMLAFPFII